MTARYEYPAGTIVWLKELRNVRDPSRVAAPRERVRIEAWDDDGETAMCTALDALDDADEGVREIFPEEIEGRDVGDDRSESPAKHEWARDPEERYGVYRLARKNGTRTGWDEPSLIATCAKDGIGTALVQLREDGDVTGDDRVGILDGIDGVWIVNPYAAGRP